VKRILEAHPLVKDEASTLECTLHAYKRTKTNANVSSSNTTRNGATVNRQPRSFTCRCSWDRRSFVRGRHRRATRKRENRRQPMKHRGIREKKRTISLYPRGGWYSRRSRIGGALSLLTASRSIRITETTDQGNPINASPKKSWRSSKKGEEEERKETKRTESSR